MKKLYLAIFVCSFLIACKQRQDAKATSSNKNKFDSKVAICCESNIPSRLNAASHPAADDHATIADHQHMVWVPDGDFQMGGDNKQENNR